MHPKPSRPDPESVFINVPYDSGYEKLFITLVGTLICLRKKPRCALEVRESGQGRLRRIQELLEGCAASIHDLSRVGPPARFNMPFELGLAYNLARYRGRHEIIVLERKEKRFEQTLSDCRGVDPWIHGGRCDQLIDCLLEIFASPASIATTPLPRRLKRAGHLLRQATPHLKNAYEKELIFTRLGYLLLAETATEIALNEGLIPLNPP